ncbi:MAG: hypothetical protein KJO21_11665 [Verrucomicrobiae bacterium]|nr:hypothetical protein [Verrucomicrobiae bacterium]
MSDAIFISVLIYLAQCEKDTLPPCFVSHLLVVDRHMKNICLILTCAMVASQVTARAALNYDYLSPRIWESSDGKKLTATLVKLSGGKITLKRKKDNKVFSLPLEKFSEEEKNHLKDAMAEFKGTLKPTYVRSSYYRSSYYWSRLAGFTDPSEKMWELAHRFGIVRDVWNVVTQSGWSTSERVIKLTPKSFKRVSDTSYLIRGQYIHLKIQVRQGEKLNISGEKLVFIKTDKEKVVLAKRGIPYMPQLYKSGLINCESEKDGLRQQLVITVDPVINRYRR